MQTTMASLISFQVSLTELLRNAGLPGTAASGTSFCTDASACLLWFPPPSRCRHLLTEVLCCMSEHFTTSFLQNRKKRVQLKHSQTTFNGANDFLTGFCSEACLRSSVHAGHFCKFTQSLPQIHPERDLDRQVESSLPVPSHRFISDLHPQGWVGAG